MQQRRKNHSAASLERLERDSNCYNAPEKGGGRKKRKKIRARNAAAAE